MSHTASDIEYFYKMGIDPDTRQQREHPVSCGICRKSKHGIFQRYVIFIGTY